MKSDILLIAESALHCYFLNADLSEEEFMILVALHRERLTISGQIQFASELIRLGKDIIETPR